MNTKLKLRIKNVTWGYRDKFYYVLEKLYDNFEYNDLKYSSAYRVFNEIIDELIGQGFTKDIIANEFLEALNKNLEWIVPIPDIMQSWFEYGIKLCDYKLYYGIKYFKLWANKIKINEPNEMKFVLTLMILIESKSNMEMSLSFLEGYAELKELLPRDKIRMFVRYGLKQFEVNPKGAKDFLLLKSASSRKLVKILGTTCYLKDVAERMKKLYKSICNKEINIGDFSNLDSDELFDKNSKVVCMFNGLYFPSQMSIYESVNENLEYYMSVTYIAAMTHIFNGFNSVQGYQNFENSDTFLRRMKCQSSILNQNIFFIIDICRIIAKTLEYFKGLRFIIIKAIKHEYEIFPPNFSSPLERLLYRVLYIEYVDTNIQIDSNTEKAYTIIKQYSNLCSNFYEIAKILPEVSDKLESLLDGCDEWVRVLSFFPDYRYEAKLSQAPSCSYKFFDEPEGDSIKSRNNNNFENDKIEDTVRATKSSNKMDTKIKDNKNKKKSNSKLVGYYYNEWNNDIQDYLIDWCCIHEIDSDISKELDNKLYNKYLSKINKIRKVFERIKPQIMRYEKNLPIGDEIILDSLINYMVEKKAKLAPEEKFYSKLYKNERDIATALLVDVSGSTNDTVNTTEVIEIEKIAAFMLAEGLNCIGDKFGIFGFSGLGRDDCRYYCYKNFDEKWSQDQKQKLFNCKPDGSTRIGPAIRHTINKLKKVNSHKKLMIVITDGKPQDSDGYTPENLYAQYDVRMACMEARKEGISVFGLSTENNSFNDLEIMFHNNRYIMMKNIENLPDILSNTYLKLTI